MSVRRREFITFLGGAAAWPMGARAQQTEPVRRIGALMAETENDAQAKAIVAGLEKGLAQLGWIPGRNLQIDYRWAAGNIGTARTVAAEFVKLSPEAIVAVASISVKAVKQATSTIPVVFVGIPEPVAQGFVASLAHPGGNLTGFTNLEATFADKWLGLLKEIAPGVTRAALMFNPDTAANLAGFVRTVEAAAPKIAVELTIVAVRQVADIEPVTATLAREPGAGLILLPDPFTVTNRKPIIDAIARHRLPAIYAFRVFATDGGLVSYGVDIPELARLAAGYVDRILKGEKPGDLPVQQPTKFELLINLKTAKTLGLTVPHTLLSTADEVIE